MATHSEEFKTTNRLVVECLPSKFKVLSSNPSTTKINK
jgi:hypothetical protein